MSCSVTSSGIFGLDARIHQIELVIIRKHLKFVHVLHAAQRASSADGKKRSFLMVGWSAGLCRIPERMS